MAIPAPRVVFARVGWMEHYQGPSLAEPRPRRGGKYNEEGNVGAEAFNFQPLDGKLYGWFQSPGGGNSVDLTRIDPTASGESLSGVRVVWIATKDDGGQVVVGWYDNSTLFDGPRSLPDRLTGVRPHYKCVTNLHDGVLLPVNKRSWDVPTGKNGFGQANVLYPIGGDGTSRLRSSGFEWIRDILGKIEAFRDDPDEDAVAETVAAVVGGQGYLSSPEWRRTLELHAMDAAVRYFRDAGYDTKDEHSGHSYDLRCTKGQETLFVEVKGTTTAGDSVMVTSREVEFARKHAPSTALFILHSVVKDGPKRPAGGRAILVRPWSPSDDSLSPITYTFSRTK